MFLYKKYGLNSNFCTFPSGDLELAQMTFDQNHDTPSDHKQSLCEVGMSNVSSYERYELDLNDDCSDRQMDGQGDSYINTPLTLFVRGIITSIMKPP